jgi:hypothetical protein
VKPRLELQIRPQPDDATCGPTCLHAVYRFYGDRIPLRRVVEEVVALEGGGTLAVLLGTHALRRGYAATIYTYNLELFDPTWFAPEPRDLRPLLQAQAAVKHRPRLQVATRAYLEFLSLGGRIRFEELSARLLRRHLRREVPILTGLSATYLYGCARERGTDELHYDDVGGHPTGHFVILCGFDRKRREVRVADPLQNNPRSAGQYYPVGIDRVTGAILLGVLTYDANFLLLEPGKARRRKP